ncbi:MAG: Ig-like domain-containing protein, partial [Candidatus Kapaibacterium sp.]
MDQMTRAFLLFRWTLILLIIIAANASAQVTILSPNGGEKFKVGSSTTIRWTGVAAADAVKLEYSIDNGVNWNLITGTATGLQYLWTGIPNTPSDKCLMRASTNAKVG